MSIRIRLAHKYIEWVDSIAFCKCPNRTHEQGEANLGSLEVWRRSSRRMMIMMIMMAKN
jgi:hypothetical protein